MNFKGFILTLGCFVASLSAATSYNIHGTVISAKDNKPLQGAIVTLQQINVADTTESDGNFLLENLDSSAIDSSEKKEQEAQGIRSSLGHRFQVSDAGYSQIFSVNGRQISGNRFTKNAYIYYTRNLSVGAKVIAGSNFNLKKESAEIFDTLLVEAAGYLSQKIALSSSTEEVNVTLDTIPAAAILKQGAGSSSQQVAQNAAIVDFSFKIANADSATVTGCPKGIEVKFENGTLYFSGKVTDAVGTYEYTMDKAADVPNIVKKQAGPHNL